MPRPHYQWIAAGIDKLEVNAYGPLHDHLPPLLDELQQRALGKRNAKRHRKSRNQAREDTYWNLCGMPLMMAPHGAGEG
jgi:hypothetical protein